MNENLKQTAEHFFTLINRLRHLGSDAPPTQEADIAHSHVSILDYVAASPGCGIQDIARGLDLATPTVSIAVRQLDEKGLITRRPNPRDGRAVQVFLTQKGETLHQRMHRFRLQKFECLLEGLTAQQRTTLLDLFEQALDSAENREENRRDQ
jgi:DNA-binding MarR family transcriptional regulator